MNHQSATAWLQLKELTTPQEIRDYFHVRYLVYTHNGFLPPGADQLDIDVYDPYSLFVGAYDEGRMVGGVRMIYPDDRAPHRDLVRSLRALAERPHPYYAENTFELEGVKGFARSEGLLLVEFGRNVCLPEYRSRGVGMALVHTIYGLALREGVQVALAVSPPHLQSFYEQLGCLYLERKGKARFPGLNTELMAMVLDLRSPVGPFVQAHQAAASLKKRHEVRLCGLRECMLRHTHGSLSAQAMSASRDEWSPAEDRLPLITRRVELCDQTLGEGLSSPSVLTPSLEGKREILSRMAQLDIDGAQLGQPGEETYRLLTEIVLQRLALRATCSGRMLRSDVESILRAGQRAGVAPQAALSVGCSALRLTCEKLGMEQVLIDTREVISYAVEHGLEVMLVAEDATRACPEALRQFFSLAIECGARRLCLHDTVGHATPAGARRLVAFSREVIGTSPVGLDWHGHQDRGLAVATSLAAIEAGADRVHASALGLGERAGTAPMEHLLGSLSLRAGRSLDLGRLEDYLDCVSQHCGWPRPQASNLVKEVALR